MNKRNIYTRLVEALSDTPVIFLRGARQTGKTTLVKLVSKTAGDAGSERYYLSLDSATALVGALEDPSGFLQGLKKPVIIDEAQRAPGLMLAIKEDVDQDRHSGRYLLTGSANILSLPGVADSLAGRMEVLTLWPLSQGEIMGTQEDFIQNLFAKDFPAGGGSAQSGPLLSRTTLFEAMEQGGYPELLTRKDSRRRAAWFDSYITTLLERDIRDIANIQDVSGLIRLLRMLAARSGTLHNQAELSRSIGIPASTLARYIPLLEAMFLIWFLPAWSSNLGKRLVKSPKSHMVDSGLACHLCGADAERLGEDSILAGRLLESFVAGELLKQNSWTEHPVSLYHYRSQSGEEVDFVLEDRAGRVAAVEVKLAASVSQNDLKGLISLRNSLGERFVRGVVLYTGQEILPVSDKIFAVPVSLMFSGPPQ